jgi:hypothetical protein
MDVIASRGEPHRERVKSGGARCAANFGRSSHWGAKPCQRKTLQTWCGTLKMPVGHGAVDSWQAAWQFPGFAQFFDPNQLDLEKRIACAVYNLFALET